MAQQGASSFANLGSTPYLPVRPRAVLTKFEVVDIFQHKLTHQSATQIARLYGVNEKTIRDIWTGRTWAVETWHLDMSRPFKVNLSGRPLGSRDSKLRKQRQASELSSISVTTVAACAESYIPHCSQVDVHVFGEQFSACKRYSFPETASSATPPNSSGSIWPFDQGFSYDDIDDHGSGRNCSLDEQLLEWEYGSGGGFLPDPFEADWSRNFI